MPQSSANIAMLLILHILFLIPYLGFVVRILTFILGLGMIVPEGHKFIRKTA